MALFQADVERNICHNPVQLEKNRKRSLLMTRHRTAQGTLQTYRCSMATAADPAQHLYEEERDAIQFSAQRDLQPKKADI